MENPYSRLKFACYTTSLTISVVGNISPFLFITFRELYGISYSLLGLLVLINFVTQLVVDLVLSFFSSKFNIPLTVKLIPVTAALGMLIYTGAPLLFHSNVYVGLALGTIIFSMAAGLAEVLLSPIIATIPSKDPDREMSKLHSVYAWGVVGVIIITTLFLFAFGSANWQYLTLLFILIPITSAITFSKTDVSKPEKTSNISGVAGLFKKKELWICVLIIFLGGSAECTMAQWSSGYLEQALSIPKIWGDIFGVAVFSLALGLGRTLYSKYGRNIEKIMLLSFTGASVCYLIAAISPYPILGLIACAMTGLCTAMLWPGTLILGAEKFPLGGVALYAILAAGGDLGASVGPQAVGIITDAVISLPTAHIIAQKLGIMPEQLGMKVGMLSGMLFPLMGTIIFILKFSKKRRLIKGVNR